MVIKGAADTQTYELKRKTVRRLSCNIRLKNTVGVPAWDLRKVTLKATLTRNSSDIVIFHENLFLLLRESMFFHCSEFMYDYTFAMNMATNWYLIPGMIDLGAPINLKGEDTLKLEATSLSGWEGPNSSSAECSIEFEWREDVGVEHATPLIRSQAIQATTDKTTLSLGDNITSVALINLNVGTFPSAYSLTDANAVWNSFILNSDKINYNDNLDRMISRRISQFEFSIAAYYRVHSFMYKMPEKEIDQVQLVVGTNGANVVATQNYVVWRTFHLDSYTMQRGSAMVDKHEMRDHKKFSKHLAGSENTAKAVSAA